MKDIEIKVRHHAASNAKEESKCEGFYFVRQECLCLYLSRSTRKGWLKFRVKDIGRADDVSPRSVEAAYFQNE